MQRSLLLFNIVERALVAALQISRGGGAASVELCAGRLFQLAGQLRVLGPEIDRVVADAAALVPRVVNLGPGLAANPEICELIGALIAKGLVEAVPSQSAWGVGYAAALS